MGLQRSAGGRSVPVLLAATLQPPAALRPLGTGQPRGSTPAGPLGPAVRPGSSHPGHCRQRGLGARPSQSSACPGAVSPLPGTGHTAIMFQFAPRYCRAARARGEGCQTHGNTLAQIKPRWHPERSSTIYSLQRTRPEHERKGSTETTTTANCSPSKALLLQPTPIAPALLRTTRVRREKD